jgi:hypothetical protein
MKGHLISNRAILGALVLCGGVAVVIAWAAGETNALWQFFAGMSQGMGTGAW